MEDLNEKDGAKLVSQIYPSKIDKAFDSENDITTVRDLASIMKIIYCS